MRTDDLIIGNWYRCKAPNREWIIQYAGITDDHILSNHSCCLEDRDYYNEKEGKFSLIEMIKDIREASEEEVLEYFPRIKYTKKEETYEIY